MERNYAQLPIVNVQVDAAERQGPFEPWRQGIGQGGINATPLPERVISGATRLRPRLIRVFLQEYFNVYPDHGVFNWSLLDPYMDSIARTGAKVLATVNLKPKALYPRLDQTVWQPNDLAEWKHVIAQVVKRYSVDKPIVTHWEHANETDIGEQGGCPFLIPTAEDNFAYYRAMTEAVLSVFPAARVGGPALASSRSPILDGLVRLCRQHQVPLDFVSWHMYSSKLDDFRASIARVRSCLSQYPGKQPEMMINEWNKGFDFIDPDHPSYDLVSVEEMAQQPRRSAFVAANVLEMMDQQLDWSHYYHIWDGCIYFDQFRMFFPESSIRTIMYKHWNETPHRFGLFAEDQHVRPQYFVYWMLAQMDGETVKAACADPGLRVRATTLDGSVSLLAVNYTSAEGKSAILKVSFQHLRPGVKTLRVYRIDDRQRWNPDTLTLQPVEERTVDTLSEFSCQCYAPADSVMLLQLDACGAS